MAFKNSVYYGYPDIPEYEELVNLVLTHDTIYDANDLISPLFSISPTLSEILENINNENKTYLKELLYDKDNLPTYSRMFVFIGSILEYHGLNRYAWIRIPRNGQMVMNKRLNSIDKLDKINKKNTSKFIEISIASLKRAYNKNPEAFNKTIDVLQDIPKLNKIVIKEEKYGKKIGKIRQKYKDVIFKSIELDLDDSNFYKYLYDRDVNELQHFMDALSINGQIYESSGLEMPLYLPEDYSNFIQYKFLRGANKELTNLDQSECYKEAYSLFIPEIYTKNIDSLIKIKNHKVFADFRNELATVINEWSENTSDNTFIEYINENYVQMMEEFMLNNYPRKRKVGIKAFLGNLDALLPYPIISNLIIGKEFIDEYRNGKKYKFALTTANLKEIVKKDGTNRFSHISDTFTKF